MVNNSEIPANSASAATRPPRRLHGATVKVVPMLFVVVLVAAVATGLWNAANEQDGPAPRSLGGLQLGQTITGPEAVAQMSKLHGKGVGVVDGYIAHYQGPSGGAVLYVGQTASEGDAALLLKQMEERIGAGNQYFTNLKATTVGGVKIFSVLSGKQTHYFWQAGDLVNWIGFDQDDPDALAAAVKAIG